MKRGPKALNPVKKKGKKRGPKQKWQIMPDGLGYVTRLALLGLSNQSIAKAFGVVEQTIYNWKEDYPEFEDALQEGRLNCAAKVADAMFRNACGYSHPDVRFDKKTIKVFDEETGKLTQQYTEPVMIPITKYYPPDTGAGVFILTNKTKTFDDPWVSAKRNEITGKEGEAVKLTNKPDLTGYTDIELKAAKILFPKLIKDKGNE
jgi:hypothetical protein